MPGLIRSPVTAVTAGAVCIAGSGVLMQLAGSSAVASALFRCLFALPVLYLLARRERARGVPALASKERWAARMAGVLLTIDLIFWSHSISAVGAGLATVLGNLQVVIVAGLAWAFMGERPHRNLALALPVLLAGIFLVAGLIGHPAVGHSPVAGVVYGAAASLLYSGYILVLRRSMGTAAPASPTTAERATPSPRTIVEPLYQATIGAAATAALLAPVLPGFRIGPLWSALGWLALLAITSQVVGWLLITASLSRLPAGLVGALLLVQPVGAVALGAVVLNQHPSLTQLAGVVLVLAGVLIATASRSSRERVNAAAPVATLEEAGDQLTAARLA
jgi:drug/metabolite transporter (DMT)-like permease